MKKKPTKLKVKPLTITDRLSQIELNQEQLLRILQSIQQDLSLIRVSNTPCKYRDPHIGYPPEYPWGRAWCGNSQIN